MMFKSKHSGWTFASTRTPFGGGGGIGNAFGLGDALASIDPGPAIGKGLAEVDTTVNRELPGGWALPAAIAVAYATGYIDPSLFASEAAAAAGAEAGAGAIATEAGQTAFFEALASGATSTEAVGAGLAADAAVGAGAGLGVADAVTATPGADAVLGSSTNIANLTPPGAGNFGTITPASGATGAGGLTGGMSAGTMVGDGTLGTTIGKTYMAAAPGQFALNAAGSAIPAGAAGIAGTVPSGLSASDILTNANRAKNLSKLLSQGAGSGLTQSLGQLAQGANPQGQALGAVVRGNPNPFAFTPQQPIQDAKPLDLASLANLLKQG
jgi:hypothetical protein